MKAEVNKTVEVVLRLTEAEAKALQELAECVFTMTDADERLGVHHQPVDELLPFEFDEVLRRTLAEALGGPR